MFWETYVRPGGDTDYFIMAAETLQAGKHIKHFLDDISRKFTNYYKYLFAECTFENV